MTTARHHAEWLSLLDITGPFLSMPVLLSAFPQGLDAYDSDLAAELRAACEEWADDQQGLHPDPAIHNAWIRYILEAGLDFDDDVLRTGQALPAGLKANIPERHETLRPDMVVVDPDSGTPRLLLMRYAPQQDLEKRIATDRTSATPATRMMELLRAVDVPLGLVTNGEQWMLVCAQRGETTAFISWYASLWLDEALTWRAFRTLLSATRFFGVPEDQTLPALLQASAKDQHEVTDQLGYQVRQAVEILVREIDRADQDSGRTLLQAVDEARLYEAALTVMMRLVFLLAAEERGMLLLGDPIYDQNYAISTLREQLRTHADRHGEALLERRYDAWCRLLATFRAVYGGIWHADLRLPAYGGSLFDPDRFPFLEGRSDGDTIAADDGNELPTATARPLPIDNRTVLHLLEAVQLLRVQTPGSGPATTRTLSFRALDIEQIGHVYEGLLDHQAVRSAEPVLGLAGTKDKEPEIPLSVPEAQAQQGDKALLTFLGTETGRSTSALRKAWHDSTPEPLRLGRLRARCGNDPALLERVLPFAGLVRDDDYGYPVVIPAGSVYVTAGTDRRQSGTHYTPRSLTEPIVQHTLEPIVYIGPAEGLPRAQWQLRPADELLALKVCDMAMGSAAFLVQACRYLAERLVEAWEAGSGEWTVNSGQSLPANHQTIPADVEERFVPAKRLIADRCLYGVDKNPLAVEMAKLSLWLVTLDKNRPFTFLDHALRHGDSLIGADEPMFERWSHRVTTPEMSLFDMENRRLLAEARSLRRQLQKLEIRDVRDAEEKARLLAEAEAKLARIRTGCDLLVGVKLLGLKQSDEDAVLAQAQLDFTAGREFGAADARRAVAAARRHDALHWPFAFPEVFAQGGFDAFVGNPPFIGGQRIRAALGEPTLKYLKSRWDHVRGSADYCAYFFLQGYEKLKPLGNLGLIATNTIAQGATLELGLEHIHEHGGQVYHADNDYPWPGQAAVVVDVVHIHKGQFGGQRILDDIPVVNITPQLDDMPFYGKPYTLAANANKSFQGSNVLGLGFTMSPEEAQALIDANPRNADVLFPYLNGQDLNSSPDQSPSRWVINFFDWPLERSATGVWATADDKRRTQWLRTGEVPGDYSGPVAADYPECLAIVREKVHPQRMAQRREIRKRYWWRYGETAPALYATIAPLKRVLVVARVTKYALFNFVPKDWVYNEKTVVFSSDRSTLFASCQCSFHDIWAWQYSSTLGSGTLNYSPRDCVESFPFANDMESAGVVGEQYFGVRQNIMLNNGEGLTRTYNRFHDSAETDPDIAHLRELHVAMDNAVAAAYGWDDLDLGHGFHETAQGVRFTISDAARREVLTRLLRLNHARYAEEVAAGLHEKQGKGKRGKGKGARSGKKRPDPKQASLF